MSMLPSSLGLCALEQVPQGRRRKCHPNSRKPSRRLFAARATKAVPQDVFLVLGFHIFLEKEDWNVEAVPLSPNIRARGKSPKKVDGCIQKCECGDGGGRSDIRGGGRAKRALLGLIVKVRCSGQARFHDFISSCYRLFSWDARVRGEGRGRTLASFCKSVRGAKSRLELTTRGSPPKRGKTTHKKHDKKRAASRSIPRSRFCCFFLPPPPIASPHQKSMCQNERQT